MGVFGANFIACARFRLEHCYGEGSLTVTKEFCTPKHTFHEEADGQDQ